MWLSDIVGCYSVQESNIQLTRVFVLQAMTAIGLLQLRPWKPRFVGFLGSLASIINCKLSQPSHAMAHKHLYTCTHPPTHACMHACSRTIERNCSTFLLVPKHPIHNPSHRPAGYMLFPALPAPKVKAALPAPEPASNLPRVPALATGSKVSAKVA